MNRVLQIYADWLRGSGLSRVSKSQSPRELSTWAFASVAIAMTEGGFAGVVVKNVFSGTVSNDWLNAGVALAAAAPATANLMSFFWADYAAGRHKVATIAMLLIAAAMGPMVIALVPLSVAGMFVFIAAMLLSRVFWAGALTVRSAVWRANNPDESRASFMGKVSVLGSASMALAGAVSGLLLDESTTNFRWFYPAGGIALLVAGVVYRSVRVRRHRQLLAAETAARTRQRAGLKGAIELLRQDRNYRRYMQVMFFFGSGNLAYLTLNVLLLVEQLELSRLMQMMITTTIPMAALPLTIPMWAHLFTQSNIARFRVGQGVLFLFGMLMTAIGVVTQNLWFLGCAAALSGTGLAAGNIGWHLGHNAFASDGRATDYMAVHVSLTGLRGLLAPLAAVGCYQWLVSYDMALGIYALAFPFALMTSGVIGFSRLSRQLPS
ncbi:MAG: MFS transporter [Pseudomonadota bacterium]